MVCVSTFCGPLLSMSDFLLLVGFHHEKGNEVEWSHPVQNPFENDKERLYEHFIWHSPSFSMGATNFNAGLSAFNETLTRLLIW